MRINRVFGTILIAFVHWCIFWLYYINFNDLQFPVFAGVCLLFSHSKVISCSGSCIKKIPKKKPLSVKTHQSRGYHESHNWESIHKPSDTCVPIPFMGCRAALFRPPSLVSRSPGLAGCLSEDCQNVCVAHLGGTDNLAAAWWLWDLWTVQLSPWFSLAVDICASYKTIFILCLWSSGSFHSCSRRTRRRPFC